MLKWGVDMFTAAGNSLDFEHWENRALLSGETPSSARVGVSWTFHEQTELTS